MEILQKHHALLTNYEVHLLLRDIAKQESELQRRVSKAQSKSANIKSNTAIQKASTSRESEKQTSSGTEADECVPKREQLQLQSESARDRNKSEQLNTTSEKHDPNNAQSLPPVSQYQTAPNLATICYELQRYLDEVTDCAVLERRNVDAATFLTFNSALRDRFGLTRAERFAIANWLPTTPIDIAALIEEADRRFGSDPEQLEQLVGLVREHLTGSAEEHATIKSEIERERSALKEPTVKARSPRKPH